MFNATFKQTLLSALATAVIATVAAANPSFAGEGGRDFFKVGGTISFDEAYEDQEDDLAKRERDRRQAQEDARVTQGMLKKFEVHNYQKSTWSIRLDARLVSDADR